MFIKIDELSEMLQVEPNVINTWEKFLKLEITTDVYGHKVYASNIINIFKKVKSLSSKGYKLETIKGILSVDIEGLKGNSDEENRLEREDIELQKIEAAKQAKTIEEAQIIKESEQSIRAKALKKAKTKEKHDAIAKAKLLERAKAAKRNEIIREAKATKAKIQQENTIKNSTATIESCSLTECDSQLPYEVYSRKEALINNPGQSDALIIVETLLNELKHYAERTIEAEKKVYALEDHEKKVKQEFFEMSSEVKQLKNQLEDKERKLKDYEEQKKRLNLMEVELKLLQLQGPKKNFWEFWK